MSEAPCVADLQRELLAVCRGGSFAETWRRINGVEGNPPLASELAKLARVRVLRAMIAAIDPNAALYYGWAGPGDEQPSPTSSILPPSGKG